ncbi:glycoside hydrolase family 18 protein [Paenibacillus roseipurpureus]|uniref:Glycoside hydrolase family 18 protein n=1 Tax=Paenibacillus roseopurpureus TaxID=2918901 RepID=A0AA96LPM9_9BACL|nr:glycoside hydrolase family 18 protein [Paenibacillus sp. MBLB1832]WNR44909.1 glycoside hydrolase family 18 protein [Paenibacillus sp. MBLB1832]
MQIHVVQKGQTLYGISQAYGLTVEEIASANELTPSQTLVIGQALVIPIVGSYYWVQPGEGLYRIAHKLGVDLHTLASINGLTAYQSLPVGFRLYIPPTPRTQAEVNAYIEPRGNDVSPVLVQAAREAAPHLTYLAPFSFRIKRDGSLVQPPLDDLPEIAKNSGVTLMMVVTNLENDQFSAELGHIILTDQTVQNHLLQNIETTADQLGFKDIHFDIEHLLPTDREAYNAFLRKATERFHRKGYLVSTALAPKTSATQAGAWYEAHDYKAHGQIVDFVIIMTYEWGYSGGPAMAVSPIGPVRKVLEYARSEMPSSKIMMGQNLYGYDWTLPYVKGGAYAKAISPQTAIDLARRFNAQILYDYSAQAPHFNYWDDEGKEHSVWFEDARSIDAKFRLIKELSLRGISYWKLGLRFPQNWLLLEDHFKVVKRG